MADQIPLPPPVGSPTPVDPPDDKSKTHYILPDVPKSWTNWGLGIALVLLILSGKLNWTDVKGYVDYLFTSNSTSVTETKTIKKTGDNPPEVADVKPISEPKAPVASITPEQIQQWITIFKPIVQPIIEELIKDLHPVVTPPDNPPVTNPPPITNPPPVVIPPVPDPSVTLKLVITDEQSKPVTSATVDINQILQVTLSGSTGRVVWNVTTVGNVSHPPLPQNLGYSVELRDVSSWVSIHAVDLGSGQSVSSRITANMGGQPPPVVNPPAVTPPVVVTPPNNPPVQFPPGSRRFSLTVVEDPKVMRSATTMSIMNNLSARKVLTDKGHVIAKTVPVTDSDPAAIYVKQQGTVLPALAIQDSETHQFVKAIPLPTDLGISVLSGMGG